MRFLSAAGVFISGSAWTGLILTEDLSLVKGIVLVAFTIFSYHLEKIRKLFK